MGRPGSEAEIQVSVELSCAFVCLHVCKRLCVQELPSNGWKCRELGRLCSGGLLTLCSHHFIPERPGKSGTSAILSHFASDSAGFADLQPRLHAPRQVQLVACMVVAMVTNWSLAPLLSLQCLISVSWVDHCTCVCFLAGVFK